MNNLKQIGLAFHHHHEAYGHFPSGGWGWSWVGDPDRGAGRSQPGSWIYDILPFLDMGAVHRMGSDGQPNVVTHLQKTGAAAATKVPHPMFNCPTRRGATVYPYVISTNLPSDSQARNAYKVNATARTDYAANGGDIPVYWFEGPASLQDGIQGKGFQDMSVCTGISHQRSEIRIADIVDGTSNTYLVGEKYLNVIHYKSGRDEADDQSMLSGNDYDLHAWTAKPPLKDQRASHCGHFGSAHATGWQVAFCDGMVRTINYSIDMEIHRKHGTRSGNISAPLD